MFNDISTNADDISEISNKEDAKKAENTEGNDILGSSSGGLPPVGMVLIGGAAFNSSPVTMVPSLDKGSVTESPNVNAFKAPYEQTDEGVHLSIPVAPAAIPARTGFNLDYGDGADSDGEIGPFYDAIEDEDSINSDDDVELEDNCEEDPEATVTNELQPPAQTMVIIPTEQQLMLRSNAELKAELRKHNLSISGSKVALVQRLLTVTTRIAQPTKAMLCNAGQKGGIYPEFIPFSPQEIKSYLGLYVLHGLTPSPQVKMKFKS